MATQTKSVGTVTENDFYGYGSSSWTNPNNIKVSDNTYATVTRAGLGPYPNTLYCDNFGFNIPAGSLITKITVKIEAKSNGAASYLDWCNLIRYGNPSLLRVQGYFGLDSDPVQPLTGSDVQYSLNPVYAGEPNLWGTPWDAAAINDATFGCVFDCYMGPDEVVSVDHVSITVDYEEGDAGGVCDDRGCNVGFENLDAAIKAAIGKGNVPFFGDCTGFKLAPEIKHCEDLTDLKDCGENYTLDQAFKAALKNDGCDGASLRLFVIFQERR